MHGGYHYVNDGCRCQECKDAHAANVRRFRANRRQRLLEDPSLTEHGKATTYANWQCRCDPCKAAHARHAREKRAQR